MKRKLIMLLVLLSKGNMMDHKFDEELMQTRNLGLCIVCGAAEGDLPSHCPGWKLPISIRTNIHAGVVDYKDGSWLARRKVDQEWIKVKNPALLD